MNRTTTTPKLALVGDCPADQPAQPPKHLTGVGLALWRSITAQYAFDDPASYQVLAEACFCASRADRCRAIIDRDGELLRIGKLVRSHPLLRDEIQNRALGARLLKRLGSIWNRSPPTA